MFSSAIVRQTVNTIDHLNQKQIQTSLGQFCAVFYPLTERHLFLHAQRIGIGIDLLHFSTFSSIKLRFDNIEMLCTLLLNINVANICNV